MSSHREWHPPSGMRTQESPTAPVAEARPTIDQFDLQRFVSAQEAIYPSALAEIRNGHKRGHWMWFIFPQLAGLGRSAMAQYYAIRSLHEARAYLQHPILGERLRACAAATGSRSRRPEPR